jgi:hypothetical protein
VTAQRIARFHGAPLDGHDLDVTSWTDEEISVGVAHVVDGSPLRADYEPEPGGDPLVWRYRGDLEG